MHQHASTLLPRCLGLEQPQQVRSRGFQAVSRHVNWRCLQWVLRIDVVGGLKLRYCMHSEHSEHSELRCTVQTGGAHHLAAWASLERPQQVRSCGYHKQSAASGLGATAASLRRRCMLWVLRIDVVRGPKLAACILGIQSFGARCTRAVPTIWQPGPA